MRVLVVGGGGREHALVHSFAQSKLAERIFCAPGNAGTAGLADNVPVDADDLPALLEFAGREQVDLTVIGPEAPLVAGLTDLFEEHGLRVFGPSRAAAQLEGSKVFAKEVMRAGGVTTGAYSRHETLESALAALTPDGPYPLVVKADGLAAGKGVMICADHDEAKAAVESCFVQRSFGAAGDVVIIEEFLAGSEVSLLVLCDGRNAVPLAPAQDYKRIFAGDLGPNTGGMGSYCPVPGFEQKAIDAAMEHVVEPMMTALAKRGIDYRGVLYAGLIVTPTGVKVLEFNCRFGDPETQAILPRLESDLLELCAAAAAGELAGVKAVWKPRQCVTVVMASGGYPASSHKGDVISGLDAAGAIDDVTVYHAGTALQDGDVVTAGGRVLAVSALGDGFGEARARAYGALARLSFPGQQTRDDIGERAVRAAAGELALFPNGLGLPRRPTIANHRGADDQP